MKKEWIIWGVIGLLAVALVIGVVALSNAVNTISTIIQTPPPPVPTTEPTTPQTEETAGQTQDGSTTPEDETTAPEETTTVPETGTKPQENTDPTEGITGTPEKETEGNGFGERDPVKPTNPTKPNDDPTTPTKKPSQEETTPSTKPESTTPTTKEEMSYKAYMALTTEEQIAFQNTFPSRNAFKQWYKTAKEEYENSQDKVTMGPGNSIDIGDLIGGKQP